MTANDLDLLAIALKARTRLGLIPWHRYIYRLVRAADAAPEVWLTIAIQRMNALTNR